MERFWRPGETVVVRWAPYERITRTYAASRADPINVGGWPHVVIEDGPVRTALYLPEGTPLWRWNIHEQEFRPPRYSIGDSVMLLFPGQSYFVSLFYQTASDPAPWVSYYFPHGKGPFYGWKVDLASPSRRTAVGFDVIDEVLDIVVNPDRSYWWKDEDQMLQLIELGIYSEVAAEEIRASGREVIELIDRHLPPFDDEWQTWRRPAGLAVGEMPAGWHLLPTVE